MNKSLHAYFYLIFIALLMVFFIRPMEPNRYLPILLVSGISSPSDVMHPMIKMIHKHIPGIYVKHINSQGRLASARNMHTQGEEEAKAIAQDPHLKDGFTFIAHSQGCLIARYFLQHYNNPPVYNYVGLAGPQRGVFGTPSDIDEGHPWIKDLEDYSSELFYTKLFQEEVSFAEYWNDSLHPEEYLKYCTYLPYLNNEKEHEKSQMYKENICKLRNMVLVQSTKEYVVVPAISNHFGFYKKGSMTETETLFESDIYKNDTLGLKTLYESGRLHLKEAHCIHSEFESDEENFINNVLPFLLVRTPEKQVVQAHEEEETCVLY